MFAITHIDAHGLDEQWPAGRVYAEAIAHHVGYTDLAGAEIEPKHWYWGGERVTSGSYQPSVHGSPVLAKLYEPDRCLSLFLVDPRPDQIVCRMLGEAWDDDALFALIGALRHLPYSHLVATAIIAQADWLDEHPHYRGLPVKQSARIRPHPDQLHIA